MVKRELNESTSIDYRRRVQPVIIQCARIKATTRGRLHSGSRIVNDTLCTIRTDDLTVISVCNIILSYVLNRIKQKPF